MVLQMISVAAAKPRTPGRNNRPDKSSAVIEICIVIPVLILVRSRHSSVEISAFFQKDFGNCSGGAMLCSGSFKNGSGPGCDPGPPCALDQIGLVIVYRTVMW
jgi:hypothetical protein